METCLYTRGLSAFVKCKPFDRLAKVLQSATNLGNAMDEMMHQPSRKQAAIIQLLEVRGWWSC